MPAPTALRILETRVGPESVDYNGHMRDADYALLFSHGVDALMDRLGIDAAFRAARHYTLFTLETHIRYLQEAHEGDPIAVDLRLVDRDAKRLHLLMELCHADAGTVLATGEVMSMGMDTGAGRPAPFPEPIAGHVEALARDHGCPQWPEEAGRAIGIRRR